MKNSRVCVIHNIKRKLLSGRYCSKVCCDNLATKRDFSPAEFIYYLFISEIEAFLQRLILSTLVAFQCYHVDTPKCRLMQTIGNDSIK